MVAVSLPSPADDAPAQACALCGLPARRAVTGNFEGETLTFCCYACRHLYRIVAPQVACGVPAPVAIGQAGLDINAPCCRGVIHGDPAEAARNTLSRLMLNAFLAMMVMVLSLALYSDFFFAEWGESGQGVRGILQAMMMLFATPAVLMLALPILEEAVFNLQVYRRLTTSALIAVGSLAAYGVSVYATFTGQGHTYFETAVMTLLLVTLGRWLDARTQVESTRALDDLLSRAPATARRLTAAGEEEVVAHDCLRPGDRIRLRPGENFPVDGVVRSGEGSVDEATITGEATPAFKQPGDAVYAGTTNLDGSFVVEVTRVGEERVMGKLVRLLDEARLHRAPIERLADRVAAWFVPVVIVLAGGTFLYWTWQAGFERGLLNGLAVLLIACPCALGIATPLAIWTALGRAAHEGIFIRDSLTLEKLSRVRRIFFDKTGTLTTGRPALAETVAGEGISAERLLQLAASLEDHAEHPIGRALTRAAVEQGFPLLPAESFRAAAGLGVEGEVAGKRVVIGSERLMARRGLAFPPALLAEAERLAGEGLTVVFIGWGGEVRGAFGLTETLRPGAANVLAQMRAQGLQVEVLTGDGERAGAALSRRLGVPVRSRLLPHQKMEAVAAAESDGPAAMVGDGLNDAPALARAGVGFALGCGADITRQTADVSLLGSDLSQIGWTLGLARRAYRTIGWNLGWAFLYNVAGVALAMSGRLHPVLAAGAMVLSSALVVGNSLRLKIYD